jgi:hypothetical protein
MSFSKVLIIILLCLPFLACERSKKPKPVLIGSSIEQDIELKYIALFILPGKGLKPIYNILEGAKSNNQLLKLRTSGILETNTFMGEKPDDAAFLSSIFLGKTTYRGSLGMNKDSLPDKNLFETAKENQYFTAFLTPGLLADSLPSAMVGHHRDFNKEESAWDYSSGFIDFIFGYGRIPFERRMDQKNIYSLLDKKGYQLALDSTSVMNLKKGKAISVLNYSSGENEKDDFQLMLNRFVRRNFKGQKVFMVLYFPKKLDYKEGFTMEALASFLEATEFNPETLIICLSLPQIFNSRGDPNLRSSIGGVSSLMAYGPYKETVMGLHSSSDFGNFLRKILEEN